MANRNAPDGFTPIDLQPQHQHRYYKNASVILAVGDPVIRAANSADPQGYPAVTRATTGGAITGVVVAVDIIQSNLNQSGVYLAADAGYVTVADFPYQRFVVQDNGGASGLVVTQIGENINAVTAIDANVVTGRSKYQIDTEAVGAGNTFSIVGLLDAPDNVVGANARWIVQPNLHTEVNNSVQNITSI